MKFKISWKSIYKSKIWSYRLNASALHISLFGTNMNETTRLHFRGLPWSFFENPWQHQSSNHPKYFVLAFLKGTKRFTTNLPSTLLVAEWLTSLRARPPQTHGAPRVCSTATVYQRNGWYPMGTVYPMDILWISMVDIWISVLISIGYPLDIQKTTAAGAKSFFHLYFRWNGSPIIPGDIPRLPSKKKYYTCRWNNLNTSFDLNSNTHFFLHLDLAIYCGSALLRWDTNQTVSMYLFTLGPIIKISDQYIKM